MVTKPYQDYPTTPPGIIADQPLVESPQNLCSARRLASSMDILQDQMDKIARQRDELTVLTNGISTSVHHRKGSVRSTNTFGGAPDPNLNPPGHLLPAWSPRDEEPTALFKGDSTNVHRRRDSVRSSSTVDGHFDPWNPPDRRWQTLSTQGSEEELEPNDPRLRVWPDPDRPWLIPSPPRVHLNPRLRFDRPQNRVGTAHPALAEAFGAIDISTGARGIGQYHQVADRNIPERNNRPTYVISAPNATHINITSRRDSPEPASQRHHCSGPDWNLPSRDWGDFRPRPHYGGRDVWDYPGPHS